MVASLDEDDHREASPTGIQGHIVDSAQPPGEETPTASTPEATGMQYYFPNDLGQVSDCQLPCFEELIAGIFEITFSILKNENEYYLKTPKYVL